MDGRFIRRPFPVWAAWPSSAAAALALVVVVARCAAGWASLAASSDRCRPFSSAPRSFSPSASSTICARFPPGRSWLVQTAGRRHRDVRRACSSSASRLGRRPGSSACWAWPVTLVWIVGLTNAFNLIDGIRRSGGRDCVSLLAPPARRFSIGRGHVAEAMLLSALVGAALGFLVYNFAPASIFLGDGGSLVFGFVLATTAITGWQKGATALAAGVPLLIFALPIADAASALLRRVFRRPDARPR